MQNLNDNKALAYLGTKSKPREICRMSAMMGIVQAEQNGHYDEADRIRGLLGMKNDKMARDQINCFKQSQGQIT